MIRIEVTAYRRRDKSRVTISAQLDCGAEAAYYTITRSIDQLLGVGQWSVICQSAKPASFKPASIGPALQAAHGEGW